MKNFLIISAPSGSGKTSICKKILTQDKSIEFSVSCTTRARRSKEKNGIDYIFLSQDEFIKKINNKEFVEWEKIHGNFYYGTLKKTLDYAINSNTKLLLELDVKGAKKIIITDSYLRTFHQIRNLMELVELIVILKSPEEEVVVDVITSEDDMRPEQQEHRTLRREPSPRATAVWKAPGSGGRQR